MMLRRALLALSFTLLMPLSALACSCARPSGGPMSEIMANKEVRILLPIEHRLAIDEDNQSWGREKILTTYRVIDSLGLETGATFQSASTIYSGGSCGYSPLLGVLNTVTTWHGDTQTLPVTSSCAQSNAAFAAEYQSGEMRRTIPDRDTCYVKEASGERSLVTDVNPNCEYYDKKGDLPLWQSFDDHMARAEEIADIYPGRVQQKRWKDRAWLSESEFSSYRDHRRIIGTPIMSRVGEDGTHSVWVLVLEDFNQFLSKVMRMDIKAELLDSWTMPLIGISDVFYIDQNIKLDSLRTPMGVDPVLFETVTGDSFPAECTVEREDQPGHCRDLEKPYYTKIRAIEQTAINAATLAAAFERLPAPLVSPAQP